MTLAGDRQAALNFMHIHSNIYVRHQVSPRGYFKLVPVPVGIHATEDDVAATQELVELLPFSIEEIRVSERIDATY
jgi:hypothetical protein